MTTTTGSLKTYLKGDLIFDSRQRIGGGGFGDLFKGVHATDGPLALKRLRSHCTTPSKEERDSFMDEAKLWRHLSHPNVLAFYGIHWHSQNDVYLVSPWVEHGSLTEYIAKNPLVDRTALIRDAAEGLAYLHGNGIVHGDLKGANALVTSGLQVVLCDFGLSKMVETLNSSTGGKGTTRWQSPELMMGGPRTFKADIYAFGIMIYEILSGQVPFAKYIPTAVTLAVVNRGERPPEEPQTSPQGDSYASLWRIALLCWATVPDERPEVTELIASWPPSQTAHDRILDRANELYSRYRENHDAADIVEAIQLYRGMLSSSPAEHPGRAPALNALGDALQERYSQEHDPSDIKEAITLHREALQLRPSGHPDRINSLTRLSAALWDWSLRDQYLPGPRLEVGVDTAPETVGFSPPDHFTRRSTRNFPGNRLWKQFRHSLYVSNLEEVMSLDRETLLLCPPGHVNRASILINLANVLWEQFKRDAEATGLNDVILCYREAVQLSPLELPYRASILSKLGRAHWERYKRDGDTSDIDEVITVYQQAIPLYPNGHLSGVECLTQLGAALLKRYEQKGEASDIKQVVILYREVLQLLPPTHKDRASVLNILVHSLWERRKREHDASDIDDIIVLCRELDVYKPLRNPDNSSSLRILGNALVGRYKREHNVSDIQEVISLYEKALSFHPPGQPVHARCLKQLGNALWEWYKHEGHASDIKQTIKYHREILRLYPQGAPARTLCLERLSTLSTFLISNGREQDATDFEETIALCREMLQLRPLGHPDRASLLTDLGRALLARGYRLDVAEAIILYRESLKLFPLENRDCELTMEALAVALLICYRTECNVSAIEEVIKIRRELLSLPPPGHPHRASSIHNLGRALLARGGISDVTEAITLYQTSIKLHSLENPACSSIMKELEDVLLMRYGQRHDRAYIEGVMALRREFLQLCPPGHCDLASSLHNLGKALLERYEQPNVSNTKEWISLCRESLQSLPADGWECRSAILDLREYILDLCKSRRDVLDEDGAITLYQELVKFLPLEDLYRTSTVQALEDLLLERYRRERHAPDVEEMIALRRESATRLPEESNLRNLGNALWERYEQEPKSEDLEEIISIYQGLIHPHASQNALNYSNLGMALWERYRREGTHLDIGKAITLYRQAIKLYVDPKDSEVARCLNRLSAALVEQYRLYNSSERADAIASYRETVRLTKGLPDHAIYLNILNYALKDQYDQDGDTSNLVGTDNVEHSTARQQLETLPSLPQRKPNYMSKMMGRFRSIHF